MGQDYLDIQYETFPKVDSNIREAAEKDKVLFLVAWPLRPYLLPSRATLQNELFF